MAANASLNIFYADGCQTLVEGYTSYAISVAPNTCLDFGQTRSMSIVRNATCGSGNLVFQYFDDPYCTVHQNYTNSNGCLFLAPNTLLTAVAFACVANDASESLSLTGYISPGTTAVIPGLIPPTNMPVGASSSSGSLTTTANTAMTSTTQPRSSSTSPSATGPSQTTSAPTASATSASSSTTNGLAIGLGVGLGVPLLLLIGLAMFFMARFDLFSRKPKANSGAAELSSEKNTPGLASPKTRSTQTASELRSPGMPWDDPSEINSSRDPVELPSINRAGYR